jgi:signal peptide peptidase SppA
MEIYRKPWAILPEKFVTIAELATLRASGEKLTEKEIRARLAPHIAAAAGRQQPGDYGVVALIPIYGVISQRMNLMSQISGGTSVEKLTAQFRAAIADPGVKAIVFDVDSPGGGVEGIPELAEEIYKSRGKKKTVAVVNTMAASAAYWLAVGADEIVIAPSAQVGSIGVFCAHEDLSASMEKMGVKMSFVSAGKYKTEGNPYEPLSAEARAALQEKVDGFYDMFVKQVAKGRGVAQASVRGGFGQGRTVLAAEAVKEGMADRVATLDETLARLGATGSPRRMAAAGGNELRAAGADDSPDDTGGDLSERDCGCACPSCVLGDCKACTNASCDDASCAEAGCPMQANAKAAAAAVAPKRKLLERYLDLRSRHS